MPGSLVFADLPRIGPLLARGAVTASGRLGANGTIPERVARVARHRQDVDRLAGYARVCGFTLRDAVPATWLHVLTFGLQIALMAERDFPFALPGLVHTTNTMSLLAPVTVADDLDLLVHAGNARPHAKGTEFDLVGEVRVGGRLAWTGTSTYLARGTGAAPAVSGDGPGSDASGNRQPGPAETGALPPVSQRWRLDADLGRRYAEVSGDVNPIHLSALSARAFGFKRTIAHGMWTHARALAALEGRLPASYRVEVAFTRPIWLPGTVEFGAVARDDVTAIAVTNREGKPHLLGEVRPAR